MHDKGYVTRLKWKRESLTKDLMFGYPLDENSVVFDVGGYLGDTSAEIYRRYECHVFVFEPIPEFYEVIKNRLGHNKKIHLFNYGLVESNGMQMINVAGNGTSLYSKSNLEIAVNFRDIAEVIHGLGITKIDLIMMNIEGGEYVAVPRLIETGLIAICQDIQIQVHDFYPNARKLWPQIQNQLIKTHYLTYEYPFFFENWRRVSR